MDTGQLTDLAMWTAIVSFFLPLVTSIIQQPKWLPRTRALVAALTSGIAGLGTVYFTTPELFDTRVTPTVVLTVMMASIATYRGFWKQTSAPQVVERASSPHDPTPLVDPNTDDGTR